MLTHKLRDDDPIRRCCTRHEQEDLHAEYGSWWQTRCLFIVCEVCGNKRCPKAADCGNKCTGSNAPGQVAERKDSCE